VVTHLNSFWKPPISLCRTLPKELLLYTARTLMRSPGEGVLQMPICGGQRSRVSFQRALHTYKNRVHAPPTLQALRFHCGKRRARCAEVTQSMKSLCGTASLLPRARKAQARVMQPSPSPPHCPAAPAPEPGPGPGAAPPPSVVPCPRLEEAPGRCTGKAAAICPRSASTSPNAR
jgi:hypothetical protein